MRKIPWYFVILFCILFAILLEVILMRDMLFIPSEPPSKLDELPATPTTILGVKSSDFFVAEVWVRTIDDRVFTTVVGQNIGNLAWGEDNPAPPNLKHGGSCTRGVRKLFESAAGEIIDCVTMQPVGEWCPAPLTSFAISKNGAVWKYEKQLPCLSIFSLLFPGFIVGGLILGVLLVIARRLIVLINNHRLALIQVSLSMCMWKSGFSPALAPRDPKGFVPVENA